MGWLSIIMLVVEIIKIIMAIRDKRAQEAYSVELAGYVRKRDGRRIREMFRRLAAEAEKEPAAG